MFSDKNLRDLIYPLFIEQLLLMLVGIADTFVVSFASEADVSGVSLANSFNTILVFLFTALSSGGAVIISQYIGRRDNQKAEISAGQLLMISFLISFVLSICILIFADQILFFLFGKVNDDVMKASKEYLVITTYSLPALAVYDAGAAFCRSLGNAKVTMKIAWFANVINIAGNCIGVFAMHLGSAGVAWPSLISRTLSAFAITAICFSKRNIIRYKSNLIFLWDSVQLKKIMKIAVPNSIENGIHQLVKVALSGMVALFGTTQVAANGVAQSIWSLAAIIGLAMAPAYTTVIGQCVGAGNINAANFYFKKLNKITLILSILWNMLAFALTPLLIKYSAISSEAKSLVIILVLINNIFNGLAYPFAGPLGNGLRAAGDVKFTMLVSVMLTIFARLFFSALFGVWFNMGAIGIALGMSIDIVFRGAIFIRRYKSQKWTEFKLI